MILLYIGYVAIVAAIIVVLLLQNSDGGLGEPGAGAPKGLRSVVRVKSTNTFMDIISGTLIIGFMLYSMFLYNYFNKQADLKNSQKHNMIITKK